MAPRRVQEGPKRPPRRPRPQEGPKKPPRWRLSKHLFFLCKQWACSEFDKRRYHDAKGVGSATQGRSAIETTQKHQRKVKRSRHSHRDQRSCRRGSRVEGWRRPGMRATLRRCQRCKCGVGLERGGHPEQEKLVNDTTSTLAGRARGSGGRAPPEGPPSTRRLARGTAR